MGDKLLNEVIDATIVLIVSCFYIPEIADPTVVCLTAIVQQAPRCLTKPGGEILSKILTCQQAESYVKQLLQGNCEAEAVRFVIFVVSLLDLYDLSAPEAFQDQSLRIVLAILRSLLYTPGIAIIIDEVCQIVLDAFNQITEAWSDWVGSSATDQSLQPLIKEACIQYTVKIQYPSQESEIASYTWESNERAQFQDFRNDVQDLLLASFACIGPVLIDILATALQSSDFSSGWEDYEAHLYCLSALADVISSNKSELGRHISGVLTSPRWNLLLQNVNSISDLPRQGAINFISRNTSIVQDDSQHLLSCVNFLFNSLHHPGSTTSASRAIHAICHKHRTVLVETLPQFINSILTVRDLPPEDRHRIFGAVAAIIQATPTEDGKVIFLVRLFTFISQYSEMVSVDSAEDGLMSAVDLLQTLAAIGKGLRAPLEDSIDLDAEPSIEEQQFWVNGSGRHIQTNVQSVIEQNLIKYPDESLLTEATCEILKSGYTEAHPSPFKFDAEYSASFLVHNIRLDLPRTSLVIETASSFLASHVSNPDAIIGEFLQISSAITSCQRGILASFAVTKQYDDHEFTHSSLDYFTRMLPKYGDYFSDKTRSESWQILFEFALLALENPDTLPRRSSAQFWVS